MLPQFRKSESDFPKVPAPAPASPQTSTLGVRPAQSPLRSGGPGSPSVIGPDLLITGNLISKGEVQVDGEVHGDIHGTNIVIGERARITGGIIAEEVVVRGHVMGSVRGKRVLLQTQSHVEGDIYHQTLAIEQGAFFEGKSRRTDDPTAGLARPEPRPVQREAAPAEQPASPPPVFSMPAGVEPPAS